MSWALALSMALGVFAVLQAALNKQLLASFGLAPAILLNGGLVLVLAVGLFACAHWGHIPSLSSGDAGVRGFRWWWLLPGLFGFSLIVGLPLAVRRIGALQVFVGVVAAQMVASSVWDLMVEHIPPTPLRIVGALLAVVGVFLVSWK